MAEGFHPQIEQKQGELKELVRPHEDVHKHIKSDLDSLHNLIDEGQVDLQNTATLDSEEARKYLGLAGNEIFTGLQNIAVAGFRILSQDKEKRREGHHYEPILALSEDLKSKLNVQKQELARFREIQKAADIFNVAVGETQLRNARGEKNISEQIQDKEEILEILGRANTVISAVENSAATGEFKLKIEEQIDELTLKTEKEKADLEGLKHPLKEFDELKNNVQNCETIFNEFQENPTEEVWNKVMEILGKIDFKKIENLLFGDEMRGGNRYLQRIYETEYLPLKSSFAKIEDEIKGMEKQSNNRKVEGFLDGVSEGFEVNVIPKRRAYEYLSTKADLTENETKEMEDLEQVLLEAYLNVKNELNKFIGLKDKLDFELWQRCNRTLEDLNLHISYIETNRVERKFKKRCADQDLSLYVSFSYNEKGQKQFDYTEAFHALPLEDKPRIRLELKTYLYEAQVEITEETAKTNRKIKLQPGNLEKMKMDLGEKGALFFAALEALKNFDQEQALVLFEQYIKLGESLVDPREKELHRDTQEIAKEKVDLLRVSQNYFAGLKALKDEKPDEAVNYFNQYLIETAKLNEDGQSMHAIQILEAREYLKQIALSKINLLDDLFADVKGLKEGRNAMVGNPYLNPIEGTEADLINQEIENLRDKINSGTVTDFDKEFSALKERIAELSKNLESDQDERIMTRLVDLYEKVNSPDKEVRKNAYTEFAEELEKAKAYLLAEEYLRKALKEDFDVAAKSVNRDDILQQMLRDPKIVEDIYNAASHYYALFKKENPEDAAYVGFEKIREMFLNGKLDECYNKAVLRTMKPADVRSEYDLLNPYKNLSSTVAAKEGFGINDPLQLMYAWFPPDDSNWYNPFSYNKQEWDKLKVEIAQTAWGALSMLPIGAAAGAVGRGASALVMRAAAKSGVGKVGLELLKEGGIWALRSEKALIESGLMRTLTPAMRSAVMAERSQLIRFGIYAGVAGIEVEAAGTYLLAGVMEGLETGKDPVAFKALVEGNLTLLAQRLAQIAADRLVGGIGEKAFAKAIAAGGSRAGLATTGEAVLSGFAGTAVEMGIDAAQGGHHYAEGKAWAKALVEEAFLAGGSRLSRIGRNEHREESEATRGLQNADARERQDAKERADVERHPRAHEEPYRDPPPDATPPPAVQNNLPEFVPTPPNPEIRFVEPPSEIPVTAKPDDDQVLFEIPKPAPILDFGSIVDELGLPTLFNPDSNEVRPKSIPDAPTVAGTGRFEDAPTAPGSGNSNNDAATVPGTYNMNETPAIHGLRLAKVADGQTRPDKPPEELLSGSRSDDVEVSRTNAANDNDIASNPTEVSSVSEVRSFRNDDVGEIHQEVNLDNEIHVLKESVVEIGSDELVKNLRASFERYRNGEIDPENKFDLVVDNVNRNSPEVYELLNANIDSPQMTFDLVEAIIRKDFIVRKDNQSNRIVTYFNECKLYHLGSGAFKNVYRVAYIVNGDPKIHFGAIAKQKPDKPDEFINLKKFEQEKGTAELVRGWNNPQINSAMHIGDDYIIYQSGKDVNNLSNAGPKDYVLGLIATLKALRSFKKHGFIHGDVKRANVIAYTVEKGNREAQLIDNSPHPDDKIINKDGSITFSHTLSFQDTGTLIGVDEGRYGSFAIDNGSVGFMIVGNPAGVKTINGKVYNFAPSMLDIVPPEARDVFEQAGKKLRDVKSGEDPAESVIRDLEEVVLPAVERAEEARRVAAQVEAEAARVAGEAQTQPTPDPNQVTQPDVEPTQPALEATEPAPAKPVEAEPNEESFREAA